MELSQKKAKDYVEILRGQDYLTTCHQIGAALARRVTQGTRGRYTDVWYFAPQEVCSRIRRVRGDLLRTGACLPEGCMNRDTLSLDKRNEARYLTTLTWVSGRISCETPYSGMLCNKNLAARSLLLPLQSRMQ